MYSYHHTWGAFTMHTEYCVHVEACLRLITLLLWFWLRNAGNHHRWNSQPYLTPIVSCSSLPWQLTVRSIVRLNANKVSSLAGQTTNWERIQIIPVFPLCLSSSSKNYVFHGSSHVFLFLISPFPEFLILTAIFPVRPFRPTRKLCEKSAQVSHSNSRALQLAGSTDWICGSIMVETIAGIH